MTDERDLRDFVPQALAHHNYASLGIYSSTHPAADVTAVLGLAPSKMHERGDANIGRTGREYAPFSTSAWLFDAQPAVTQDADNGAGFESLRELLTTIGDLGDRLATLRPHYKTVIWWTADSRQGNFSLPPDLVAQIGELGCWLHGNLVPVTE